jgi:uncharacterized membrane protein
MNLKKTICLLTIFALLVNCSSNSSDDLATDPNPTPTPTPTTVTYNANIKSIISNNCTACHGSTPTNGAPMSLTTYSQVKNAVENRDLISRINSTSRPMPTSGLMSQSNRKLIQDWKDNGFLEN